jgi:YVTN family beta-propeller protein
MKTISYIAIAILSLLFSSPASAETIYTANENASSLGIVQWPGNGTSFEIRLPDMPHNVDLAGGKLILITGMSGDLLVLEKSIISDGSVDIIEVGGHPAHVVANKLGNTAYVTLSGENVIAVVDLIKRQVVKKIPVGRFPHGLRLRPDGKALYVANMKDNTVSFVDVKGQKEYARVYVGKRPVQVAISPDGSKVYVSLNQEDAVAVLDASKHTVTKKINVGPGPVQLAIAQERLFVANQGNPKKPGITVTAIDLQNDQKLSDIQVGSGPHGVASSPDSDRVYITNVYDNSVVVIDATTLKPIQKIDVGLGPNGIVVAP